eukprot:CAMPEP_0177154112 /NCGR_PEP_ID=MMETSP0367-20130122/1461_1 /TAXON_ID=447022 ORGANISM="Scrippsiella hangoei-like, Strain SHHI-4" /NCGR_SAMPLE_ID=MMETSP0367 /ASSEMBLY_ACC=CAM_ASM_000362 /LENGTH=172 /DNA_ID=CAMNT_0018599361 /DNA_START=17 /DNA_END=532 /DNA_ORIENTATION=+
MNTGPESGFDLVWGLWCITYFIMVFSLLLNFFLAIVVDSYSNVKEAVKSCQIERDIVWDVFAAFTYPLFAFLNGLPQRGKLIAGLIRADLDQDGKNDEEGASNIPVTAEMLDKFDIVKSKKKARSLFKFYQGSSGFLVRGANVGAGAHKDHEGNERARWAPPHRSRREEVVP